MWFCGLDLRSIKLTVVKVLVSSERTCNNCLFVEVFNWFLDFSNEIFDFLANNSVISKFLLGGFRDKRESTLRVSRRQKD